MLKFALLAALAGLSAAQWGTGFDYYGRFAARACAFEPSKPRSGRHTCDWLPIKNPLNGCIMRWTCKEKEASPLPCPEAPAKPETGRNCNWVTMRDERGCIVDYECEPVTQPPCPRRPQRPDNSQRCYYRSIKNNDGCVVDYECEPLHQSRPFFRAPIAPIAPAFIPRPAPIAPAFLPRFSAPVAAPLPAIAPATNWAAASAAAASLNQANIARAVASASALNNAAINTAASRISAFAPRLPILKDPGQDTLDSDSFDDRVDASKHTTTTDIDGLDKAGCGNLDATLDDETRVPNCDIWAHGGQCTENPDYMKPYCKKSCQLC